MSTRITSDAWFNGNGRSFAVLYAPDMEAASVRRAALLVQPPGPEQVRLYRFLREAAAQLAAQGTAVLRIELAGTGNSTQALADSHFQHWLDDIASGWADLRRHFPGADYAGIGVRYGAGLLLEHARLRPCPQEPLVLCAPLLGGADWVASLARTQQQMRAAGLQLDSGDLAGVAWPAELLEEAAGHSSQNNLTVHRPEWPTGLEVDSSYVDYFHEYQIFNDISSNIWSRDDLAIVTSAEAQAFLLGAFAQRCGNSTTVTTERHR